MDDFDVGCFHKKNLREEGNSFENKKSVVCSGMEVLVKKSYFEKIVLDMLNGCILEVDKHKKFEDTLVAIAGKNLEDSKDMNSRMKAILVVLLIENEVDADIYAYLAEVNNYHIYDDYPRHNQNTHPSSATHPHTSAPAPHCPPHCPPRTNPFLSLHHCPDPYLFRSFPHLDHPTARPSA